MAISVRVRRAHVVVTEAKQLYVKWTRGKDSIDTGKIDVNPDTPLCEFKGKGSSFNIKASFYPVGENEWKEDLNSLALFCGDEQVGIYSFNLSDFIGKEDPVQSTRVEITDNEDPS